jgi:hypothetical protein
LFEHLFERRPGEGLQMRRYADPVEVRQGILDQSTDTGSSPSPEGPEQFLWRGRLWTVRAVLAHWVETGPWWQSVGARAVSGAESAATESAPGARIPLGDLLTERELWRVEAGRGRPGASSPAASADPRDPVSGVFDLSFDWADGRWTLVGCVD